jgi:hypothetical protein
MLLPAALGRTLRYVNSARRANSGKFDRRMNSYLIANVDLIPICLVVRTSQGAVGSKEFGAPVMTIFHQFNTFAASRGEGLHPKLRDLLERTATSPFSEVEVRHDGMLQAGPAPKSEKVGSPSNVISFLHQRRK